jgi:hypothetical protein
VGRARTVAVARDEREVFVESWRETGPVRFDPQLGSGQPEGIYGIAVYDVSSGSSSGRSSWLRHGAALRSCTPRPTDSSRSEHTGGVMSVIEETIPARRLISPHSHQNDVWVYVLSGEIGVPVGDQIGERWLG